MLLRQSAIYLVSRLVPAVIAFGLVALYTRLLGPQAYGAYAFVTATAMLGVSLTATWLSVSAIRLYPRTEERTALFWALLVGILGVLCLGALVTAGLLFWLKTGEERLLLLLGFLLFGFTAWFELNADLLAARLEAVRYLAFSLVRTALSGALGAALAWAGWGAEGILIGLIAGVAVPGLFMVAREWRGVRLVPGHPPMLRRVLTFGVPLSLSYALGGIVFFTDRFIVSAMQGAAMLGLYAVGFDLADRIIKSLTQPLGTAALPLVVSKLENEGIEAAREQASRNLILLAGLVVPATAGVIAVTPELVEVMVGAPYRAMSREVIPLIALGAMLSGLRSSYFDHAFQLGLKTGRHVLVVSLMAVTNLVLGVVLVSRYGAVGAAYGTLAAYAIGLVASILVGRTAFIMPFAAKDLGKIGIATLAMLGVLAPLPELGALAGLALKVVLGVATYLVCATLLGIGEIRQRIAALPKAARALALGLSR
jgi:O-antigen/teichoic acid export membrane protein